MCGIAGFYTNLIIDRRDILVKMLNSIYHRGPDEEGTFFNEDIALGMRRLSVIDLNTGKQPICNEDKSILIVYNGEIYNFRGLSSDLKSKGHSFHTKSDTECIIHSYEEYGIDCLKKLRGMFAFCVYDYQRQILFCARDRLGKKPLHFYADNDSFVFSSEIKAILKYPSIEKKINESSLEKYLLFGYVPAPNTIFKGINKLLPGHYLVYDLKRNKYEISKYWEFDFSEKVVDKKINSTNLENSLLRSVEARLVSDVPLGVFLSGGIDSSLIVAMMSKFVDSHNIKSFSIGFEEKSFDESTYASEVARQYGTDHKTKIFRSSDCLSVIEDVMKKIDEPFSDPSMIPTYLLSKFTREHVTVALSGDGGDEMFGGYPKYYIHKYSRLYNSIPAFLRVNIINKIINLLPTSSDNRLFNFKVKKFIECSGNRPEYNNQLWVGNFAIEDLPLILCSTIDENNYFNEIDFWLSSFNGHDFLDKMMFLDVKLMLQDMYLVKVDRTSMLNSLEVRSPFLDSDVVECSSKIPSNLKIRKSETKYILKQIALKYLTRKIVYRKKRGFGLPIARWIKEKLWVDITDLLKDSKVDFINTNYVLKLIDEHKKSSLDHSGKIWNIYILLLWYNRYGK